MHLIPTVIEKDKNHQYAYDIYSKLLEERIILLTGTIDDAMASSIIGQLLYLEAQDNKNDIYMYINSPGGSVSAGLAILIQWTLFHVMSAQFVAAWQQVWLLFF